MDIRKKDPSILPISGSAYLDWEGTSCAENSVLVGSGDLYALAGLDSERDRWSILAIDMDAHSHGADPRWTIHVYAADRVELNIVSFEDWERVAAEHGAIPVLDILLHDATLDDVVKCMKLVGVQLRLGHFPHPLLHTGYADHPGQN